MILDTRIQNQVIAQIPGKTAANAETNTSKNRVAIAGKLTICGPIFYGQGSRVFIIPTIADPISRLLVRSSITSAT